MSNDNNYLVQKNKYSSRANNFLILGATSLCGIIGTLAFAPAMGAVAISPLVVATGMGLASISGFTASKVAENYTSAYETQTIPQRLVSKILSIRDKVIGQDNTSEIKNKI